MKKFTLLAACIMMCFAANAQTVQVFKDGQVVGQKAVSEIDSIAFNEQDAGVAAATLKQAGITMEVDEEVPFANLFDANNLAMTDVVAVSSDESVVKIEGTKLQAKAIGTAVVMFSYVGITEPQRLVVTVGTYGVMVIEDVFTITGRGTVATGTISAGGFAVGQNVTVLNPDKSVSPMGTVIAGLEMFKKSVTFVTKGDQVGMMLRGLSKSDLPIGGIIAGSGFPEYKRNTTFTASMYVLTKAEGGRHTPFWLGYRPQIYVNGQDYTVLVSSLGKVDGEDVEMVMPGNNVTGIQFSFDESATAVPWTYIGMPFILREGGHTVARGVITGF